MDTPLPRTRETKRRVNLPQRCRSNFFLSRRPEKCWQGSAYSPHLERWHQRGPVKVSPFNIFWLLPMHIWNSCLLGIGVIFEEIIYIPDRFFHWDKNILYSVSDSISNLRVLLGRPCGHLLLEGVCRPQILIISCSDARGRFRIRGWLLLDCQIRNTRNGWNCWLSDVLFKYKKVSQPLKEKKVGYPLTHGANWPNSLPELRAHIRMYLNQVCARKEKK